MEQKQNSITNDELLPSAHHHAKPMLVEVDFVPSVGQIVNVTQTIGDFTVTKKAKILKVDYKNHPKCPFLVMFGRNPYLEYVSRNLIYKL